MVDLPRLDQYYDANRIKDQTIKVNDNLAKKIDEQQEQINKLITELQLIKEKVKQ